MSTYGIGQASPPKKVTPIHAEVLLHQDAWNLSQFFRRRFKSPSPRSNVIKQILHCNKSSLITSTNFRFSNGSCFQGHHHTITVRGPGNITNTVLCSGYIVFTYLKAHLLDDVRVVMVTCATWLILANAWGENSFRKDSNKNHLLTSPLNP